MAMFDLMSDFVARINNSARAGKSSLTVLKSKLISNVCKKLVKLGYLNSFDEEERVLVLHINLEKITKLKRVSKPGKRVYVSYADLPKIEGGIGWNILTSSKGILTNFEAKTLKVGGELLFQIY
jgi:small subunit ribosomal protein S8